MHYGEEGIRVWGDDRSRCSPGGLVMPVPTEGSSQPSDDTTTTIITRIVMALIKISKKKKEGQKKVGRKRTKDALE